MHLCMRLWLFQADFKYYYDCLMAPNTGLVLSAIKRIGKLDTGMIATGHGRLLQHHLGDWVDNYQKWSQEQAKTDTLVAVFHSEDYGYSDQLARAIAHGILRNGVEMELLDLSTTEPEDVGELVSQASGLVIGMPSQSDLYF